MCIPQLSNLSVLNISNNQLSGNIPSELNDLLSFMSLDSNYYTFSDIETLKDNSFLVFKYSPQYPVAFNTSQINKSTGDDLELNIIALADKEISADSNQYKWWKNGIELSVYSESTVLSIDELSSSDRGYYHCTMVNSELPDLTLYTDSVFLVIDGAVDITLSPDTVDENVNPGSAVGILTALDPDQTGGHTFSLIKGNGTNDADNDLFSINEDNLMINTAPDYETQDEYHIYVRATDDDLQTFDNALVVYVNNIDETHITSINNNTIKEIQLFPNYPNPFAFATTIPYFLPEASQVEISLYDITGREIQVLYKGYKERGSHSMNVDAGNLSSGVYFYTMKTKNFELTRKCMISK